MTDRSRTCRRPYLKSITCYQEDIGRRMTGGVAICTPADVWNAGRSFMNRNASAVWKGTLHGGEGKLTTESGVLSETQYSYRTSFPEGIGTNPDELIAASLGGCFSMALSNELGLSGFHPESIETTATATLEDLAAGWTLTRIQLDVHAIVPDVSKADFIDAALAAKAKCPIARLLNTNISMTASLDP
jgi:lipoyl-dependent peroxiredoxin